MQDANSEASELARRASTEPKARCREAFASLDLADQAKFFAEHALPSAAAAEAFTGRSQQQNIDAISHLLSRLPSSHSGAWRPSKCIEHHSHADPCSLQMRSVLYALVGPHTVASVLSPLPGDVVKALVHVLPSAEARLGLAETLLLEASDDYTAAGATIGAVLSTAEPRDLARLCEGLSAHLGGDGKVLEALAMTLGTAQERMGIQASRRPDAGAARPPAKRASTAGGALGGAGVAAPGTETCAPQPRASMGSKRDSVAESMAVMQLAALQKPQATACTPIEQWKLREAELLKALEEAHERESRADAVLARMQAQLREVGPQMARRQAQLDLEKASMQKEMQAKNSQLAEGLAKAKADAAKAARELEAATMALESANASVKKLDTKVATEITSSEAARMHWNAERLEIQSQLEEATRALQAEKSAREASDAGAAAAAGGLDAAAVAERRFGAERRGLQSRLDEAEQALAAAKEEWRAENEREQTQHAQERQRQREAIGRLELEVGQAKAEAEAGVEVRILRELEEDARRLRAEFDERLQLEHASAAQAAAKSQMEAEAAKASALKQAIAELNEEHEKRLDEQREAVHAEAQTAMLAAQLHSTKPLGSSTGIGPPAAKQSKRPPSP